MPGLSYEGISQVKKINSQASKAPLALYKNKDLEIKENDLIRITSYSGFKTNTIYDYLNQNKQYSIEFSGPSYRFTMLNFEATKPSFIDIMYSVTDKDHKGIEDLQNTDFTINEDGNNIVVSDDFQRLNHMIDVPFQIVLMLDNSSNIGDDLGILKEAALSFVRRIRANQKIALYSFSDAPTLLQDFTNDTTALKQAVESISLGQSSINLYGSVITALSRWSDEFTKTNLEQGVLVLFTNNDDTQATKTLNEVLAARENKKVYVVGVEDNITPSILNEIANPSDYISIQTMDELNGSFGQIQADIVRYSNSFYWLNYMSSQRGGNHDLVVSIDENTYEGEKKDITTNFNSDDFVYANAGVFANVENEILYGIDSIYCFYDDENNKYSYTTSRYGNTISEDSLILRPITYFAYEKPNYNWRTGFYRVMFSGSTYYSSAILKTNVVQNLSTEITLEDIVNDYTKTIHFELLPEALVISELFYNHIANDRASIQGTASGRMPIISKGVVWSQSPNPTVDDNKIEHSGGDGSYISILTDLEEEGRYYVRPYVITSEGTIYGEESSFQTNAKMIDIEGNLYKTVTIGDQVWMAENLKTSKLNDGTDIPYVVGNNEWISTSTPAYSIYNHDENLKNIHGALYNWFAVETGKLCPEGWHVSTRGDWGILEYYLTSNGYDAKEDSKFRHVAKAMASTSGWAKHETGVLTPGSVLLPEIRNKSGFTALPSGMRGSQSAYGEFKGISFSGTWWTSTQNLAGTASSYNISYYNTGLMRSDSYTRSGFSVRCVKDIEVVF